jgi:hypothetical protein
MSPLAWGFLGFAASFLGVRIWVATRSENLTGLDTVLAWSTLTLIALLPAAVLWWKPDAWQSARLVLIGAIAWTTFTAALAIVLWVLPSSWYGAIQDGLGTLGAVAGVVAFVGPALVAFGLEGVRGTRPSYPTALVLAAILVLGCIVAVNTNTVLDSYRQWDLIYLAGETTSETVARVAGLASQLLWPLAPLCMAILAWTALSGARAREAGGAMWPMLFAGAAILFGLNLYQFGTTSMLAAGIQPPGFMTTLWYNRGLELIDLAAVGLIVAAFVMGGLRDPSEPVAENARLEPNSAPGSSLD